MSSCKSSNYRERVKMLQSSSGMYQDDGMLLCVYNNKLRNLEKDYITQNITEPEYMNEKCKIQLEIERLRKNK